MPYKDEVIVSIISFLTPTWVDNLKSSYLEDVSTKDLYSKLKQRLDTPKGYTLQQSLILRKGRIWIAKNSAFKLQLLAYIHSNPSVQVTQGTIRGSIELRRISIGKE